MMTPNDNVPGLMSAAISIARLEHNGVDTDKVIRLFGADAARIRAEGEWLRLQLLTNEAPATSQPAPGFVLVPTIPNRDMDRIMQAEDWQWSDVLAAAGTATEAEIGATPQDAEDAARMAFLADNWKSEIEGKRLHDWLGDIGTLLKHGSLRKAIDFARTPPEEAAS